MVILPVAMVVNSRVLLADLASAETHRLLRALETRGTAVMTAAGPSQLEAALRAVRTDVVVVNLEADASASERVLLLARSLAFVVIAVTDAPSVASAVLALRCGAFDYLTHPYGEEDVVHAVERGVAWARAIARVKAGCEASQWLWRFDLGSPRWGSGCMGSGASGHGCQPFGLEPTRAAPGVVGDDSALARALSDRQRTVVAAFCRNPRVDEVASELGISPNTVKNHLQAIYRKLEVHSQAELLALVRRLGLHTPEPAGQL